LKGDGIGGLWLDDVGGCSRCHLCRDEVATRAGQSTGVGWDGEEEEKEDKKDEDLQFHHLITFLSISI